MENLGKTSVLVIEPKNFDLREQKVFFPDFGFVLTSESRFFRDMGEKLCMSCHEIRKKYFGPKILTEARKRMKELATKSVRAEREFLELMSIFFDIAYYTAISRDKGAHLRKFVTYDGLTPKYYLYVGSMDVTTTEVLDKLNEIISNSKPNDASKSCFEVIQLIN